MRNRLYIISGPSGVGKGTLVKELLKLDENLALSVSCTTRKPRAGERDGVDYFFLTRDEFLRRVEADGFLEYDEHFGNYYGTPKDFVREQMKEKSVILEIDVVGALNVQKRCGAEFAPVLILVVPPDEETLIHRLEGRASEDEDALRERLARARYELSLKDQYDYVVVNDDLKETAARLIFAEIGDDLSSFPDAEHFASWIGVCPGNNESAGHAHRSGTPKGNKYLRTVLIECAQAIGLMRKGVLFQRFQAFAIKKGRLRGVMAMAHLLARIIFSILKSRTPYREVSSTTLRDVNVKKVTAAMTTAIRTAGLTLRDGLLVVEKTGEILVDVEDCARA